jgi:hypothetical protein
MNTHLEIRPHPPWYVRCWVARLHRLLRQSEAEATRVTAVPTSLRQRLLAAQDQMKSEQRTRMLALLQRVKR